ncbi:ubiquitin-binding TORC1 subunit KOG1 [Rhodotorula paludigena]|uniref:ubiquitin-binding TORC1 subunit KOG1 n=1 Tax=Rhodotorula paludigena TaxID=86838 RepID=UPI003173A537
MARLAEHPQLPSSPSQEYSDASESDDYDESVEDHSALDYSGYGQGFSEYDEALDPDSNMRHGFAEAYSSEEYLQALEKNYFLYWTDTRHERVGLPKPPSNNPADHKIDWRNRDRIRTASAVLVVCLRIGYDPPDVIKTDPCAKLECWVDPYAIAKDKAMERIGKNLQQQFENLAATPKTRYKQYLDPPVEDAKKFCTAARKTAKNERTLFYYNGHGVPKPTPSGELWLFNRQYTQYIPVSLGEIIGWIGSPAIYVWDCSAAGNIVTKVQEFSAKRDAELARDAAAAAQAGPGALGPDGQPLNPPPQIPTVPFRDTIQLAACLSHETLPMNPDLPADLFTCCLTSPIEIALRFFLLRNPLKTNLGLDMLLKIPGKLNDRRTPLGELNWIFTAVTDTIAWNTLPRDLFQKLFRHDLVVAALFRGFLLAERIMRFYECTPISVPALPQTHNHPLWDSWDLAVDMCLAQLPTLLEHEQRWLDSLPPQPPALPDQPPPPLPPQPPSPYIHSTFFAEQLTAFEIWLEQGTVAKRRHPEQLPVVLQVLLSQAHRLKALILLCKFLDLGPWAVNVALSIGIFAYVLRLLQAPAVELKPVLIYIWARILAVYENCKEDLLKQAYPTARGVDQAPYTYFVQVLHPSSTNQLPLPNVSEHRAMCAFILAVCCRDYKPGQVACLRVNVFESCLVHLRDEDPLLRQWAVLCIAMIWDDFDEAKGMGVKARVHEVFCSLLHTDPVPEVRAAVMYALGTLLGTTGSSNPERKFGRSIACSGPASGLSAGEQTDVELGVAMATLKSSSDGSPPVRRELIVLLSSIVNEHQNQFIIAAYRAIVERVHRADAGESPTDGVEERIASIAASLNAAAESNEGPSNPAFQATMFSCMYQTLAQLTADPQLEIAELAQQVMDYIFDLLFSSPLGPAARAALHSTAIDITRPRVAPPSAPGAVQHEYIQTRDIPPVVKVNGASTPPVSTGFGGTIKRTATAMKSLAHLALEGGASPSPSAAPTPPPGYNPSAVRLNGKPVPTPTPGGSGPPSIASSASTDSLRHLQARSGRPPTKRVSAQPDPAQVEAIIAQLVQQDEERLKKRRQAPNIATAQDDAPDQVFPLKGTFFDFALEYYKESQMRATEADEPGSVLHNERVWRRQRNEAVIIKTQPMKVPACRTRWDEQVGFVGGEAVPNRIMFHQFEPHLISSDDKGNITIYEWEKNVRVNYFANGTPPNVPITTLRLVNEDDVALLMTASADGDVRLFRSYESPDDVKLVSSFQGISEELPRSSSDADAGLVVEWQQGRGQLLMGGNVKYIRVWDATRELTVQDLPTRANSCLTSLTCDQVAGNIVVAGFGDGSLRVYDRRMPPRDNMVRRYTGVHDAWVQNVHMQRGGNRELATADLSGQVCLWDIRLTEPIQQLQAHQGGLTQMTVHEHAPIFATSSAYNVVKLWNMNDLTEPFSKFRNTSGLLATKQSNMTFMAFHPHHMVLGCASSDGLRPGSTTESIGHINIFEMEKYRPTLNSLSTTLSFAPYI